MHKKMRVQGGEQPPKSAVFVKSDSWCLRMVLNRRSGNRMRRKSFRTHPNERSRMIKMKKQTAAACALLVAIAAASLAVQPVNAAAATSEALSAYAGEVAVLVNEERAIYGLPPVQTVPLLNQAAQIRAEETTRQFSHTRPDGRAASAVLEDLEISWRTCGENIAYGYKDAEAVMDSWMHSEGHRANILNAGYEYLGIGVAESGGMIYCTQIFTGGIAPGGETELPQEPVQLTTGVELPAIGTPWTLVQPDADDGFACAGISPQSFCVAGNCLPVLSGLLTGCK